MPTLDSTRSRWNDIHTRIPSLYFPPSVLPPFPPSRTIPSSFSLLFSMKINAARFPWKLCISRYAATHYVSVDFSTSLSLSLSLSLFLSLSFFLFFPFLIQRMASCSRLLGIHRRCITWNTETYYHYSLDEHRTAIIIRSADDDKPSGNAWLLIKLVTFFHTHEPDLGYVRRKAKGHSTGFPVNLLRGHIFFRRLRVIAPSPLFLSFFF